MKHLILLIALASVVSCKKANKQPSQVTLEGRWQWVQSSGGIAGATSTPASTGDNFTIEFTGSRERIFKNSSLVSEWQYYIDEVQTPTGNAPVIKYDPYKPEQLFTIEGNKLFLSDRCDDCYTSEYVREN